MTTANCDLREPVGLHSFVYDVYLMEFVGGNNVACGGHCGDPDTAAATVQEAAEHGLKAGRSPRLSVGSASSSTT